eukprot:TRINITY_DN988_c1_g1_i3.p1 TRINITY_DN988_c1_g1~~TRINITY_DN988_c1_g1_i3.p1  ORF type:complete len:813 (+),score=167.41 TRINITY_DN988_c1_g1_i3:20-2458(+)
MLGIRERTSLTAKNTEKKLLEAAREGNQRVLEQIISTGSVDINFQEAGWTALLYVAGRGNKTLAELLIKAGADVNQKSSRDSWTPLHYAVNHNHLELARLLLEQGADLTAVNGEGKTAGQLAKSKPIISLLARPPRPNPFPTTTNTNPNMITNNNTVAAPTPTPTPTPTPVAQTVASGVPPVTSSAPNLAPVSNQEYAPAPAIHKAIQSSPINNVNGPDSRTLQGSRAGSNYQTNGSFTGTTPFSYLAASMTQTPPDTSFAQGSSGTDLFEKYKAATRDLENLRSANQALISYSRNLESQIEKLRSKNQLLKLRLLNTKTAASSNTNSTHAAAPAPAPVSSTVGGYQSYNQSYYGDPYQQHYSQQYQPNTAYYPGQTYPAPVTYYDPNSAVITGVGAGPTSAQEYGGFVSEGSDDEFYGDQILTRAQTQSLEKSPLTLPLPVLSDLPSLPAIDSSASPRATQEMGSEGNLESLDGTNATPVSRKIADLQKRVFGSQKSIMASAPSFPSQDDNDPFLSDDESQPPTAAPVTLSPLHTLIPLPVSVPVALPALEGTESVDVQAQAPSSQKGQDKSAERDSEELEDSDHRKGRDRSSSTNNGTTKKKKKKSSSTLASSSASSLNSSPSVPPITASKKLKKKSTLPSSPGTSTSAPPSDISSTSSSILSIKEVSASTVSINSTDKEKRSSKRQSVITSNSTTLHSQEQVQGPLKDSAIQTSSSTASPLSSLRNMATLSSTGGGTPSLEKKSPVKQTLTAPSSATDAVKISLSTPSSLFDDDDGDEEFPLFTTQKRTTPPKKSFESLFSSGLFEEED